ncbi:MULTISPECIES: HupE/UreJ family protein [unclassified Bradyrhizobium]|uniref:HupE/UreJ family protein n=1 Tax=unclassified Bradyrhizobium TaxID=2631580 RepID=UPI0028EA6B26|nr:MULTISPECIES: HupE/UreJ family protein [unclassified Bradyrhizobium]
MRFPTRFPTRIAFAVAVVALFADPASAHHMMGGKLPQTLAQGLLSGLAHPVIGLDHFAAIVGAGIVAALIGRGFAPVLAFTTAMIAGVMLHVGRADIPAAELLVGLSTAAIGLLILLRAGFGVLPVAILFALTGIVHGYALGESIVGAESAPLGAYLAGLLVIQSVIAAGALLATRMIAARGVSFSLFALRIAGAAIALVGGAAAAMAAGLAG